MLHFLGFFLYDLSGNNFHIEPGCQRWSILLQVGNEIISVDILAETNKKLFFFTLHMVLIPVSVVDVLFSGMNHT